MRDIKFRGKRVDNGEWVQGYYLYGAIKDEHIIWTDHENWKVEPETVGQYIGLTIAEDDIYDGDVVVGLRPSHWHDGYEKVRAVVTYKDDIQAFSANGRVHNIDELEVIGNIHDNPELLQPQGENKLG
ncbi:YopX protein [compost metagenome]